MPFDAATAIPAEVRIIDKALELLGPNGEHWTKGIANDREGNRCIVGALRSARRMLRLKGDKTTAFILTAVRDRRPEHPLIIEYFNDDRHRKFDEVAAVLTHARKLAGG